jgi:hypothetical protein
MASPCPVIRARGKGAVGEKGFLIITRDAAGLNTRENFMVIWKYVFRGVQKEGNGVHSDFT